MTPMAVRKAAGAIDLLRQIAACELITAAQAFDLRKPERCAHVAQALRDQVRKLVPPLEDDRSMTQDVVAVADAIRSGAMQVCLEATGKAA